MVWNLCGLFLQEQQIFGETIYTFPAHKIFIFLLKFDCFFFSLRFPEFL